MQEIFYLINHLIKVLVLPHHLLYRTFPDNQHLRAPGQQFFANLLIPFCVLLKLILPEIDSALRHICILTSRCLCQKQPWTKIAVLYFASHASGCPGILFAFFRYRYPLSNSLFLNHISGFVSLLRIFDMLRLRASGDLISAIRQSLPFLLRSLQTFQESRCGHAFLSDMLSDRL